MSGSQFPSPSLGMRLVDFFVPCLILAAMGIVTIEFMLIGLLPELAGAFGAPIERTGLLISLFALGAAIGGPILTFAVAPISARQTLAGGLAIFAFANIVVTNFPTFEIAAIARVIQGMLLPPLISIGSALAAAMAKPGKEGKAIAHINFGTVLGTVIAVPAAAGGVAYLGWEGIYHVTTIFVVIMAILVWITAPKSERTPLPTFTTQLGLFTRPNFLLHLAISGLLFAGMFTAYSYIMPYLTQAAGLDAQMAAAMLMGFGLFGLLGNWIAGRLVDRDATSLTKGVALLLAFAMLSLAFKPQNQLALFLMMLVWGAAHIAAFVTCQVRVMQAGAMAAAFAGSLNIAAANLGLAAGAVLGGWMANRFDIASIGLAGAALCAIAFVLTFFVRSCK